MAGKDLERVRHVATRITHVLEGITDAKAIHGDVKPRNFVMVKGDDYAAIDLDAAAFLDEEVGQKETSSGCLPPEQARVVYHRNIHGREAADGPKAVKAQISYDMWQVYSNLPHAALWTPQST